MTDSVTVSKLSQVNCKYLSMSAFCGNSSKGQKAERSNRYVRGSATLLNEVKSIYTISPGDVVLFF